MGVGGQRHAPAALPPAMTRYPLIRRLGGPQGRSGRCLDERISEWIFRKINIGTNGELFKKRYSKLNFHKTQVHF
jgi:hypothetical protein